MGITDVDGGKHKPYQNSPPIPYPLPLLRFLLGHLAVGILKIVDRLPIAIPLALGTTLLPFYLPFRFRTRAKLRNLRPPVGAFRYYRMRLRLALLSAQEKSAGKSSQAPDDGTIEGRGVFADALSSGKPVLLLGWHQGPVESLHRIPAGHVFGDGRRKAGDGGKHSTGEPVEPLPFFVMTASAFSPALADWMARRRRRDGVGVIRPGETSALRKWERDNGILAVMVDQVSGEPEAWLSLREGSVKVPWPGRLIAWATAKNPEILAVSTRLERGRIVFRYDRIPGEAVQETVARLMEDALRRAPEQYNWSYGKASVELGAKSGEMKNTGKIPAS